jgi:hypothetical protein
LEEGLKVILSADVSAFEQAFVRATNATRQAVQQINQNLKGADGGMSALANSSVKLVPHFEKLKAVLMQPYMREFGGHTKEFGAALSQASQGLKNGTLTFDQLLKTVKFTDAEMAKLPAIIASIPIDWLTRGIASAEKTLVKFGEGKRPVSELKDTIERLKNALPGLGNSEPVQKLIQNLNLLTLSKKELSAQGLEINPKVHVADTIRDIEIIKGLIASEKFTFDLSANPAGLNASLSAAATVAENQAEKIQQAVSKITFQPVSSAPLVQKFEAAHSAAKKLQDFTVLSATATREAVEEINSTLSAAGGGFGQFAQKAQKAVTDYVKALGQLNNVPTAVKTTVQAPDISPVLQAVQKVKSEIASATVTALPKLTLSADTSKFTQALLSTKAVSQETWAQIRQTFVGVDTAIAQAADKARVSIQQIVQNFNALKGVGPQAVVMQVQPPNYAPVIAAAKVAKRNIDQVFLTPLPQIKAPQFSTGGLPELKRNLHDTTGVGLQFNQLLREMPNFAIDARIGVMSLSNNLPYFVDALQNARRQGQGFGAIMKTLGASIFSVSGIALLAVTAFTAFAGNMRKSKDETKDAREEMEKYVENLDVLSRARLKGEQSGYKEAVNLRVLYEATQNHTLSLQERKKAVDALQAQYPNYFKNISDEIILAGKAKGAYDELTNAILRKAKAESAQEELKNLTSTERTLRSQRNQSLTDLSKASTILKTATAQYQKASSEGDPQVITYMTQMQVAQRAYNDQLTKTIGLHRGVNVNLADQEKLVKEIASYGMDALTIDPAKGLSAPKGSNKPKFEFLDEWLDFNPNAANITQEQRAKLLEVINRYSDQFGQILEGANFRLESSEDKQIQAAKEWWDRFQKGFVNLAPRQISVDFSQVPIVPDVPAVPDVQMPITLNFTPEQIKQNAVQDALNSVVNRWREIFKDDNLRFPSIDTSQIINPKDLESIYSRINDFAKSTREILSTAAVDAVSGFAEGVGAAMAGGNLGEAFSNVLEILGSAVVQMGKKLIETSAIMEAFKKALNGLMGPGGTQFGFAIGAAMIAIGSAMKSVKMPKFADGGIVFGPTMGLMGEYAGASSNPEVIAPLNKLKDLIGGSAANTNISVNGNWEVAGDKLRLVLARSDRKNNRYS